MDRSGNAADFKKFLEKKSESLLAGERNVAKQEKSDSEGDASPPALGPKSDEEPVSEPGSVQDDTSLENSGDNTEEAESLKRKQEKEAELQSIERRMFVEDVIEK